MIQELFSWLDAQRITYIPVDTEVVDIPGFGRLFTADLSGVESIFRGDGDKLVFNLMESPDVLMEEGIFHVAFPFGRNWYYYDQGLAWKQHQENKKKSVKKYKAIDNTEYMEELVRKRGTNRKIKYDQKKIA